MKQDLKQALTELSDSSYRLAYKSLTIKFESVDWDTHSGRLAELANRVEDAIAAVRRNWPKPYDIDD